MRRGGGVPYQFDVVETETRTAGILNSYQQNVVIYLLTCSCFWSIQRTLPLTNPTRTNRNSLPAISGWSVDEILPNGQFHKPCFSSCVIKQTLAACWRPPHNHLTRFSASSLGWHKSDNTSVQTPLHSHRSYVPPTYISTYSPAAFSLCPSADFTSDGATQEACIYPAKCTALDAVLFPRRITTQKLTCRGIEPILTPLISSEICACLHTGTGCGTHQTTDGKMIETTEHTLKITTPGIADAFRVLKNQSESIITNKCDTGVAHRGHCSARPVSLHASEPAMHVQAHDTDQLGIQAISRRVAIGSLRSIKIPRAKIHTAQHDTARHSTAFRLFDRLHGLKV